jgi:NAD-dependent SIR2 family protein deacetylase
MEQAKLWIQEADYVLIAAGAGMSASAGLDYTDVELFRIMFPPMARVGFRNMYHFIGYHSEYCPDGVTKWSPELKWGYLADQCNRARYNWPRHEIYQSVLQFVRSRDEDATFVVSTNADGMFVQNGFDENRIFNPQGDYSYLQCLKPCRKDAFWETRPVLDAILPTINQSNQMCSSDVVPVCPYCQGPAFFNVRGGKWFINDIKDHHHDFTSWLRAANSSKLVVLEIGVGFNTPSVLRWPMENIVASNEHARLIRINMEHPEIPEDFSDRGIGFSSDATSIVVKLMKV